MQHLRFFKEPRSSDEIIVNRRHWVVRHVTHHGGTRHYTLVCRDKLAQGEQDRTFSAVWEGI